MSSAFTFFRRNQQVTMVAVVILSMLAFTLDTVFSDRGTHFVLLGMLIGTMVFSFFGFSRGQWIRFGVAGAVLGAACGFLLPKVLNPSTGYFQDSVLGAFDEKRMMDLQLQRNIPNMFMQQAFEKAIAPGTAMYAPQFGFGHEAGTDDLTFAEMMRAEADDLGIVVTDKMVSDWINRQTQEKLSRAAFAEIRQNLNFGTGVISEEQLLDCFRSEIKALMAYQILRPQPSSLPQGPDVYYATFKRTKVRERLNTVRLDVDAFLAQIDEPSDAEIAAAFQEGRLRFPNELEPGSPGFRQFSKAKLAYLELGYKKVEASIIPPTDAEIEAFYKDNLDKLYRKPAEPAPSTPDKTPAEASDPLLDTTPAENPTEEPKVEEPKVEEPEVEEPKVEEPKVEEPKVEEPKVEEPKVEEPKTEESCSPVLDEPVEAEPAAAETTSPDEEPVEQLSADKLTDTPATDTPATDTPATDTPATDVQPAATPDKADTPEFVIPKVEYKPLDEELKAEIREQMLDDRVRTALEDRLNAVMIDVKKLEEKRRSYRFSLFEKQRDISKDDLYEKMRESSAETLDALKALAAEHNCEFVVTPLLSYSELVEGESYPIGTATVPAGDTVAQHVFSTFPDDVTNDTTLFAGERAVRNSLDPDGGETQYAWVITEYAPTFVPTLEDAGIRDQVVLAIKRSKARELARNRGEELVKLIKAGLEKPEGEKKTMSETLEGLTVLGKEDSPALSMRQTLPFSWMEQSMTPQMNFMQQPTARLSSIRFADEIAGTIRYAGPKFMQVVFEEIGNNDVAVVPNEDFSSYYVVQVLDRTPADQNGEDILRQQFLTEGKQFGFSRGAVATVIQSDVAGPTALEWEKATWRKYGIDPDERRDE
jgi:hypothetical protein